MHVLAVPQIAPQFGLDAGNVIFDGPEQDEDFGLEQVTGNPADRYRFRTSPQRNVSLQPAFFHNGTFTRLDDAIEHHRHVVESARTYDPVRAGVDRNLTTRVGPIDPVLERVDPLLQSALDLTAKEVRDLTAFVRTGYSIHELTVSISALVPATLPSGMSPLRFEDCRAIPFRRGYGRGRCCVARSHERTGTSMDRGLGMPWPRGSRARPRRP